MLLRADQKLTGSLQYWINPKVLRAWVTLAPSLTVRNADLLFIDAVPMN